jgi:hypothetical protein
MPCLYFHGPTIGSPTAEAGSGRDRYLVRHPLSKFVARFVVHLAINIGCVTVKGNIFGELRPFLLLEIRHNSLEKNLGG